MSSLDELEKLASLKEKGVITAKEFADHKAILLNQSDPDEERDMIPFGKAYALYWKNAFRWRGRATRAEFWWPRLANFCIGFILGFVGGILSFALGTEMLVVILSWLFSLAMFFPDLSVYARRAHDIGKSALYAYLPLLIFLFVFLILGIIYGVSESDVSYSVYETLRNFVVVVGILEIAMGVFGLVWWLIIALMPSQKGANKYGEPR